MPPASDPVAIGARSPGRASVGSREDAERLLADLSAAMAALENALETEAGHIAAGRLRQGLAGEAAKAELSAAYLLALQACKANVVALARFAPARLQALRVAQMGFQSSVERNLTVLATARTVSEDLMRSLAEETARAARPAGYGPPAPRLSPSPGPLVFSRRY